MQETMGDIFISEPLSPFDLLPEDCISKIISFTSPRDACVAACASKTFESAVQSDIVWEKFLPQGYASLILGSKVSLSKKELFFSMCDDPLLIEDGKKSFWLEKASGKRCIMLSSKEMWIGGVDDPRGYWAWISIHESRFEKIAELINICWFEIRADMHSNYLSPRTRYSVYFVFKTKNGCPGMGDLPIEVGVTLEGKETSQRLIYFIERTNRRRRREMRDVTNPKERIDGWMEAELGEFFTSETCSDGIKVTVSEFKNPYWKSGLIFQGIEFRPTKNP